MPPELEQIRSDASLGSKPKLQDVLHSIRQFNPNGQQQSMDPAALDIPTEELEIMRAILNAIDSNCKGDMQEVVPDASSAWSSTNLNETFAIQLRVIYGWCSAFFASVYATLLKARPLVLSIKVVLVSLIPVLVFFSTTIPRALDAHKRVCSLSSAVNSPICASYDSINLTVLDFRRPEYTLLSSTSQDLLDWGEELRKDATAATELQTQLVLASEIGVITLQVDGIGGGLGRFSVNLQNTADGARDVSLELERFLKNLVRRLEMAHAYAKNSFISRVTFGLLVPNYPAEIIQIFAQTHTATYISIKNAITLMEDMKTLLLVCRSDANTLTDFIAKELLHLETEVDARAARGAFARLHVMLSDAMSARNSGLELEARERHLDDVEDVTKDALDHVERILTVLHGALAELEWIKKYASVPVILGPHMSMEMKLALAKDMSSFEHPRADSGTVYQGVIAVE